MHPGESSDAIVTWTAPWSGLYTFDITAILLEANLTCSGDGVLVYYGAKEATNQLTVLERTLSSSPLTPKRYRYATLSLYGSIATVGTFAIQLRSL